MPEEKKQEPGLYSGGNCELCHAEVFYPTQDEAKAPGANLHEDCKEASAEVHIQGSLPPNGEAALTAILQKAYTPFRRAFLHPPSACLLHGCPDCTETVSSR